jgi:hypothetical protein
MLSAEVKDFLDQLGVIGDAVFFTGDVEVDFPVVPTYEHWL